MVKDPLSDFLVRLKNAQAAGKQSALVPYSAFLWEIAKTLEKNGYLTKIDRRGKRARRMIETSLVYDATGAGRIGGIKRISKQSKRVYKKASELFPVRHGQGVQIISTSRGIVGDREARDAHLGGEVLFEIW